MIGKSKQAVINIMNFLRSIILSYKEKKFIRKKVKTVQIYEGSDEEYKNVVLPFWKKYNMKPDKRWYQYFGYNIQKFDPYIIPGDFFYSKLLFSLTNIEVGTTITNKIYADYLFKDINKPKTILRFNNGFLVDENIELTNENNLEKILFSHKKLIYKPSGLLKGQGVRILKLESNLNEEIEFIKKKINEKESFIIQELVEQSDQLARFNLSSVNTIRLITLLIDGKVEPLSAILRVGGVGKEVDNYSQGGYSRPIDKDGYLGEFAMQNELMIYEDYQGDKFTREKLIGFDKVIEQAKKYHPYLLDLRWVGWDFAIGKDYEPVFIEINDYSGDNQRECGPTFGELTPKVLDEYFENRK